MNFHRTTFSRIIISSTVAVFAFVCTSATVIADKANFSGQWTLNESKSELGQFGARMIPKTIKITQTADDLSVDRTSSFNGQERTSSEKLTFDGKETESTLFANAKRKASAKWSDDGKVLTVSSNTAFDRNGETMEFKSTEAYKISDDSNTLTIDITTTSQRGTNTVKAVYEKSK